MKKNIIVCAIICLIAQECSKIDETKYTNSTINKNTVTINHDKTVRISYNDIFSAAPLIHSNGGTETKDNSTYAKNGISASFIKTNDLADCAGKMANHETDLAILSFPEFMTIYPDLKDKKLKVIALTGWASGRYSVITVNSNSDLLSLSGKKISSKKGSLEYYAFSTLFEYVEIKNISWNFLSNSDDAYSAMSSGTSNACIIDTAELKVKPDDQKYKTIISAKNIPGVFPIVIVALEETLMASSEKITKFITETLKGSSFFSMKNEERKVFLVGLGVPEKEAGLTDLIVLSNYMDNLRFFGILHENYPDLKYLIRFYSESKSFEWLKNGTTAFEMSNTMFLNRNIDKYPKDSSSNLMKFSSSGNKVKAGEFAIMYKNNQENIERENDDVLYKFSVLFSMIPSSSVQINFLPSATDSTDSSFWNERARSLSGDISSRYGIPQGKINLNYNQLYSIKQIAEKTPSEKSKIILELDY